ncbi:MULTISPECIES: aminodeoxychorismate synthase component I [unclassified Clostridioides]|uniref:aminodeoxychorismate synthase component I n=1 Tax=unclassified Clostridioides TaxID=2635829 RepID=UPI001D0C14E1|nr:aminodeoxychorismate synthase component I [Clostridioides sp. ES-S-0001-03]MCC0657744.1 aminodeoxychorismate synthase component I [Clostridioides sp. ES-S-0123-01]MCC0671214.1 aminodeoxychorismate synthase component I [Clostridioides sp. ES-S-0145-01]MCC0694320.1 aminodeoxychorismate synthase component I [Clostridioides sp. ES-S-0048-02]MCC0703507.1 aminodeoxychorismate synthase component I [Clostridioides sp. ES-S-0049-02]MCC0708097.1 aminodeoxychorismate synthase component I [Clostridioid
MIREIKTKLNSFEIFTIFRNENDSFILDSAMDKEKLGRYSFISSQPFKVLRYKNTDENPLENLKKELDKYKVVNKTDLPFIGGAVGYLSYDLGNYIEKLPRTAIDDIEMPDMYFGFYNHVIVIDHLKGKTYIATPDIDIKVEEKIIADIEEKILTGEKKGIDSICYQEKDVKPIQLKSNFTKEEFKNAVGNVREYIRQGDIYQANLTQRFSGETELTSFELYRDLRRFSPAPFGAFLNFEEAHILSNSPERFIRCIDKKIEARPIKGTRPRGKNKEEDLKLQEELKNSEKDRAELLMIVDLERNDIGRISKTGSVKVPELFVIEPYANVNHLVSTVVGELKDDKDATDIIKATFPGGSITGAPKIRAMEIIDELEPTQRNVYTGSIGYIGFNGDMDFNIAIRTIIKKDKKVYFQVGGGMTWDSDPDEEYQETLDKAKSIMKALRGYYEE